MPKKSNTRRSDGRIAVQVYLGTVDGKRRYKTVYGKTQKEANQKAEEIRVQVQRGVDMVSQERSFSYWAQRFLLSRKSRVSVGWYETMSRRVAHLSDRLGKTDVGKIRLCDVQTALDEIAERNPYNGKPTTKKTLTEYASLVKQIFRFCAANRVIDRSPIEYLLDTPNGRSSKHRKAITAEQRQWIEDTPHRAQLPAMIMLYAGLRRGELSALTWADIDLQDRVIHVTKSYDARHKAIKSTKTAAGMRDVPIPAVLSDFLSAQPRQSVLVCPSAHGEYMSDTAWKRLWESYMRDLNKKYGKFVGAPQRKRREKLPLVIDTFTPHELRHTFSTMLYDAGVDPLTAREMLGHTDIKTTLSIYTHLSDEKRKKDTQKFDSYLVEQKKGRA